MGWEAIRKKAIRALWAAPLVLLLAFALAWFAQDWLPEQAQGQTQGQEQGPSRGQAPPTGRRIIERDGKTLLWAAGTPGTDNADWFDVTDSLIDPHTFQYGIGKDRIPSIDRPEFAGLDDVRLAKFGINGNTMVVGYAAEGEAKAYPVYIMDRHEIVNDTFGDVHLTVAW